MTHKKGKWIPASEPPTEYKDHLALCVSGHGIVSRYVEYDHEIIMDDDNAYDPDTGMWYMRGNGITSDDLKVIAWYEVPKYRVEGV